MKLYGVATSKVFNCISALITCLTALDGYVTSNAGHANASMSRGHASEAVLNRHREHEYSHLNAGGNA